MKEYASYEGIIRSAKWFVNTHGLVLNGSPEIEMAEKHMERGSYEVFYFRILSEKTRPYRRAIYFEVTRHESGLYSLHISFDW